MQEDIAQKPEWKTHLSVASPRCPVSFIKEIAKQAIDSTVKLFQ